MSESVVVTSKLYFSRKELAERWGCTTRTIDRMVHDGELEARRIGPKMIRFHRDTIDAFEAVTVDIIEGEE